MQDMYLYIIYIHIIKKKALWTQEKGSVGESAPAIMWLMTLDIYDVEIHAT